MQESTSVFTGLWVAILALRASYGTASQPSHLPSYNPSKFRVIPLGGMLIFGGTLRVWPQICRGYLWVGQRSI
ncbi:hypothetical protein BD779DRAFT_1603024 [Infundibulicybe gibba]|nr:hypothetical protein BD779DRAFT_1603024 [Infundibulicybe gibba]